jgi:excisionase family DNA binding protein
MTDRSKPRDGGRLLTSIIPRSERTIRASARREELPEVYSVAEVAELFGRQPRTVRGWIADGRLPCVRIGRAVFVPEPALRALFAPGPKSANEPTRTKRRAAARAPPRKAPR